MLNLPHEMIYGLMMTSFYFIFYYFLFFAGNVYNCNAYTKRLFETFSQRTVKLFECKFDKSFHSLSFFPTRFSFIILCNKIV